jgi:flavin reductase (DIM6/NTAB) family NADH-FMN oxidoreductase RutF
VADGVDSALFRQVLGHFASGVTVVSAQADGPVGLSVGAFFSVSLDPPLIGFCVKQASGTWPLIRAADSFCVNILGEHQEEVSRRFAATDVDRFERFDGLAWESTPSGAPRLVDALAWIECRVEAVHAAGDHDICVGRVDGMGVSGDGGPLVYYRSGYGRFAP